MKKIFLCALSLLFLGCQIVNADSDSDLLSAAKIGDFETVKTILTDATINVNTLDDPVYCLDCTPLRYAVRLVTDQTKRLATVQEYIGREAALPTHVSNALQKEIANIIHESREHVTQVLSKHTQQLHEVARQLMEKGTLYGYEVYKICGVPEPSLEYSFVKVP